VVNPVLVRDAQPGDLAAILAIYNHAIVHDTAVFDDRPYTPERLLSWFENKRRDELPVLVAELEGVVVGFATFGQFRPWSGYHDSLEHSLYVSESSRRRGAGRALLFALLDRARARGAHVMVAGLSADNEPSLALHEAFGFERVGLLREVGRKFDRWLDLLLLERVL
jgi:phosphinothricin acetyltransferase